MDELRHVPGCNYWTRGWCSCNKREPLLPMSVPPRRIEFTDEDVKELQRSLYPSSSDGEGNG